MTVFDSQSHIQNEGHDPSATVDPTIAAQSIGTLLGTLMGHTGSGAPGTDPLSQSPKMPQAAAPAAAPTAAAPMSAQTATGNTGAYPVTQAFGVNGEAGIDLGAPVGTPVLSPLPGTVTYAGPDDSGFGNMITIDHGNGVSTVYGHISGFNVKQGDQVTAGQVIAPSGNAGHSSGPHLELQVRINGTPVNPAQYLAQGWQVLGDGKTSGPTAAQVGGAAAPATTTTTTTPATPEEQLGSGITNVGDVLSGKGAHDQPGNKQTTQQGQQQQGGVPVSAGDGDPNSVDSFLAATRQHESGGDYSIYNQSGQSNASGAYQFLNSTWKSAGGSTEAAAQASPAEQDRVARSMAMQLFNEFHSWRLVAAAWYGGPGIAQQMAAGQDPGSPQGQGAYKDYADTIARMMAGGK